MPDTRSFPEQPGDETQAFPHAERTEAIPQQGVETVAFPEQAQFQQPSQWLPTTNAEKAHYWMSVQAPDFPMEQRVAIAQVYATLSVQDAIRDVTASMVRLGAKRK